MARIAGVDIPREKRVDVSLRYIFGIGATTAREVLEQARIEGATRDDSLLATATRLRLSPGGSFRLGLLRLVGALLGSLLLFLLSLLRH